MHFRHICKYQINKWKHCVDSLIVGNAGWTSGEFQKEMGRLLCAIQAQTVEGS